MIEEKRNEALEAEGEYRTAVEDAYDYVENFDILETITNVGNDEVFTPRKTADMILDSLPEEVWHNPNYRWLNPATKNGIFEREIAIRLDKGLKEAIPDIEARRKHILQNMIFSIGQTKFTSNVARRTLYYCSQANRKCDGIKAPDGHYVNGYAIGNGTWFDDEEGNIKTPSTDHEYVDSSGRRMPSTCMGDDRKKYHCKYCGISGSSNYNDINQREKYAYELIHVNHLVLERYMRNRFFGGNKDMKFDIVIGNPPYQLSDGGAQSSAKPIYHLFVQQAIALNPKYLSLIIPSRWMAGGKGLDDFRESMLKDRHIMTMHDFVNAKECFPNNDIPGGVCFFVWSSDYNGKCDYYRHLAGNIDHSKRYLKEEGSEILIRDQRMLDILRKVRKITKKSFSEIVSSRKPYGLTGDFFKDPSKYNLPAIRVRKEDEDLTIYGLDERLQRTTRYIGKNYPLPKVDEGLNKYKIFIAEAYGCGIIGEKESTPVLSTPILGIPNDLCTETFLQIGPFQNEDERNNCLSYIRTKFMRFMVGIKKISQHCTKDVYEFAPLVSFDVKYTDKMLYEMFGLSEEEINYIEQNIKEMN